MKFNCSKESLSNAVQTVFRAVPSKTTMNILQCILIEAEDNNIKLTANDMELGIETNVKAEVVEKGKIALDAKLFQEIVRKLPDSVVYIDTDENLTTTIVCEKSVFNLAGKSGDDFSYLPEIEKNNPLVISQYNIKELITKTIFSIADNDSNKIMTGELFDIKGNIFRVAALDGHRISIRKIELKDSYENRKVIVPGKTLNELSKILPGDLNKDVSVYFTSNHILFEFDNTIVLSRLIEGEYFNIDQMLSNDYETKFEINKKDFVESVDRAMLLIRDGNKKPIIVNVEDNKIDLKIKTPFGSLNEEIESIKVGKDITIGFNPKFLLDALRVIDDEIITLYMVNSKAPCFIKNESETYIYLVLPVNFNAE